jgi:hypothetical protein
MKEKYGMGIAKVCHLFIKINASIIQILLPPGYFLRSEDATIDLAKELPSNALREEHVQRFKKSNIMSIYDATEHPQNLGGFLKIFIAL